MKILEICPYSSGACGVWTRVKQESLELIKLGYNVKVFSSYFDKGTNKTVSLNETFEGISIQRFKAKKLGGESFMKWDFIKKGLAYSPDVIIVHNYRHLHTTKAIKLRDKLKSKGKNVKLFLVTHAPFVEGNITRTKLQTLVINFYDKIVGPKTLPRFDKILTISKWEIPFLIKCGAPRRKIVYFPNGIPREFFHLKPLAKEENKILFLSRVSPKKKLDTLIKAISLLKDKKIKLEIVGPREEDYFNEISSLIKKLNLSNRVKFLEPVYNLNDKIAKIDSCKVFVLPSRVEGMPQALIESMARGKIVIGSNSVAIRDLIKDKQNGYLFHFDDPHDLALKIDFALSKNSSLIKKNAAIFAKQFNWDILIKQLVSLF